MNAKSYKVEDGFYLNELLVNLPKEETEVKVEPKHQYIIIDRSGSMWGDLDGVIDTIISYVESLPEGSKVSLGYFSGYNEYGLSVPYELQKEKDGVVKTMNSYRHCMGCTNFTEILEKIKTDCKDRKSSLFFFTDGCHNCGPFSQVIKVLEELREFLDVSIFVGCGWINRENMIDMAKTTEGSFVQLNSFKEFKEALDSFGESIEESVPGCIVELPLDAINVCSILGKNIISYVKNDKNEVFYKASAKKKQVIYFTSYEPFGVLTEFSQKDELCARAMIHNLIQRNKTPLALKILNAIGDKYYLRKLNNTFTEEEYAEVENEILKSIFDGRKRYKEGQVKGYLPNDNAFCVLDALDVISNDDKAFIHLNDPDFIYKKTSRACTQIDGSKLEFPKDTKARTNNLKYHENRLNVNLNVSYKAKVPVDCSKFSKLLAKDKQQLNEEFTKYNLKEGQKIEVNCIRNYNIILDGKLNTKKLVLSGLSKESVSILGEDLELREDGKYILDLSKLTLINKSYLSNTSAKTLANLAWEYFYIGNELSVIKYLISTKTSSEDQGPMDSADYMAENLYIKNGMYQPPIETVEATDEYLSYEFNISFKGFSKASASAVYKKIKDGAKITDRESIMAQFFEHYKDKKLEELEKQLDVIKVRYKELQTEIQHAKFAIILINRGCMDEFDSRENMNIDIDVSSYNLPVNTITTQFKVVQKPVKI